MLSEVEVKPVNSNVWGVANVDTVTSELNALAIDGFVTEIVFKVLALDVDNLVLLAKADALVLKGFISLSII